MTKGRSRRVSFSAFTWYVKYIGVVPSCPLPAASLNSEKQRTSCTTTDPLNFVVGAR